MPRVLAYHVVFTAYGFWLPNDPRGSWSDFVGAWELFHFGRATRTQERRSLAREPHDRRLRLEAKASLLYRPVKFDGRAALRIAQGFAHQAARSKYSIYACSILPEHVHMVIARLGYKIETVVGLLKRAASQSLEDAGCHPMEPYRKPGRQLPTAWAAKCWKVFLDSPEDIRRAIAYVECNPLKEGKKRQSWRFIREYVP